MALESTEHGTVQHLLTAPIANNSSVNKTANFTSANQTNALGVLKPGTIVDKPPFAINSCDQVIFYQANTLKDNNDYTSRIPAFFTISAYMINMFESIETNKLKESINIGHIRNYPALLIGSKTCIAVIDKYTANQISICAKDDNEVNFILKAYSSFMDCRAGSDLKEADPVIVNNILKASCNGFNSTTGTNFDMPAVKKIMEEELIAQGFNVTEQKIVGGSTVDLEKQAKQGVIPNKKESYKKFIVPGSMRK